MDALVLPGLDGSAELRAGFIEALAPEIEADVLAYPTDVVLGYGELFSLAQTKLPRSRPFLLIGESFSGPIAIRLAALKPNGLAGLVLCSSFVRKPVRLPEPITSLAASLPLRSMPNGLVSRVMMGRWSTPDLRRRLHEAIEDIEPAVFKRRIAEVTKADATQDLERVTCPLLFVSASSDRLLWADHWKRVHRIRHDATRVVIAGPHMLLQVKPAECADTIKRWQYTL